METIVSAAKVAVPRISAAVMQSLASEPVDLSRLVMRGIEKEGLRVSRDGYIAQTPHPKALGSALTHPRITTDYSEALLEFITPASHDLNQTMTALQSLHQFTYRHLSDELIWATSMPCQMTDENQIPIAEYGSSNIGKMKYVYRVGLGHRYGRTMQTIAGVHYNFSLSDEFWQLLYRQSNEPLDFQAFKSARYLGLIRNFQRMSWLIVYLFGASPAMCKCFTKGKQLPFFEEFDQGTFYGPHSTSLRMSDLGYQNKAQANIRVRYNDLDEYISGLRSAIGETDEEFAKLGVKVDGEYRQLNANVLQIENEYYSPIRPKRVGRSGEKPTDALARGGIEYIEVRALDIDPFEPLGIAKSSCHFLDVFLIYCALIESPPMHSQELEQEKHNLANVVKNGRDPSCTLQIDDNKVLMRDYAEQIFEQLNQVAEWLSTGNALSTGDNKACINAVSLQRAKLADPMLTPSGKMLQIMLQNNQNYFAFAMAQSEAAKAYFSDQPLSPQDMELLTRESRDSLEQQQAIEKQESLSFDDFLADYFG